MQRNRERKLKTTMAFIGVALVARVASAAPYLMLDFGAAGTYTGTDSPAHAAGAIPTSYGSWVQVSNVANLSTQDGDGNAITVDLGRRAQLTDVVQWDQNTVAKSAASGSGVFGSLLTRDALIPIGDANIRDPLGVAISGLPNGRYKLFVVAHYASNVGTSFNVTAGLRASHTLNQLWSKGNSGDVYASPYSVIGAGLTASNTSSWEQGNNYAHTTFTIDDNNKWLYVFTDSTQGANTGFNATLSSIQIAPIPPPGTVISLR